MRLLLLALLSAALYAQPRPAFEVATLKRNTSNCQLDPRQGPSRGRLDFRCLSMRAYIRMAHVMFAGNVMNTHRIEVLGGPSWLDNERYDISAKAPGEASTAAMVGPMLQSLLEERLQLQIHKEPRETPVYALTLATGGHKLKRIPEGACTPLDPFALPKPGDATKYCNQGTQRITADRTTIADWTGLTIDELANPRLAAIVQRPVVNRTALEGRYDFHLEFAWTPPSGAILINGQPAPPPPPTDSTAPSIFTALQSLGLKLTPTKAPIDVIVIDRVERPSEN